MCEFVYITIVPSPWNISQRERERCFTFFVQKSSRAPLDISLRGEFQSDLKDFKKTDALKLDTLDNEKIVTKLGSFEFFFVS